ncbi:MAG TPA: hypothetical protein VGA37_08875 [Gemmatimonadales bacterium]
MIKYYVRLTGPDVREGSLSGSVMAEVLHILADGARRALRLRVEGRSTARGPAPSWLARGADFQVTGLTSGSAVLIFEAAAVEDATSPGQFGLFDPDDNLETTGLGLLQESIDAALAGDASADTLDDGLLESVTRWRGVLAHGVDVAELRPERGAVTRVTLAGVDRAEQLRRETPPPQRVRVAGWLDQIRHSDRMFTIKLGDNTTLRGLAEGVEAERLAALFGKKAIVAGMAYFRPSGRVLRIEADRIEPADESFGLWSFEPKPALGAPPADQLRKPQGPRTGMAAIIGEWPGDESDEDVDEALRAMS